MSTELVMLSNHLFLCHPLLILSSIFLSIKVFSNKLTLHISWPKYWSFSFSISPSSEYSGFISFMTDWVDLLESKGLWSLLQHHSSKASILLHSPFFMVQLSHPNMTTGEAMALKYTGYFICLYLTVHDSLKDACRSGLIQVLLKIEYILSGPRLGVNFLIRMRMWHISWESKIDKGQLQAFTISSGWWIAFSFSTCICEKIYLLKVSSHWKVAKQLVYKYISIIDDMKMILLDVKGDISV